MTPHTNESIESRLAHLERANTRWRAAAIIASAALGATILLGAGSSTRAPDAGDDFVTALETYEGNLYRVRRNGVLDMLHLNQETKKGFWEAVTRED